MTEKLILMIKFLVSIIKLFDLIAKAFILTIKKDVSAVKLFALTIEAFALTTEERPLVNNTENFI